MYDSSCSPKEQLGQVCGIVLPLFLLRLHVVPGALYFFNQQSLTRPLDDQYICRMVELDPSALEVHPEDEPRTSNDTSLRFVVCMGAEGSRRLLGCQKILPREVHWREVGTRAARWRWKSLVFRSRCGTGTLPAF